MIKFRSLTRRVRRLYNDLEARYPAGFSLDDAREVAVGGRATPVLLSGEVSVNLNHATIDVWGRETGGISSIFVLAGEDFVRIATNVKDASGVRAVGVVLDRSHPAYARNRAGAGYYGYTTVAGRKFIVDYQPIVDSRGMVVGIFSVGVDIANLRMLTVAEKIGLVAAAGSATLLVARTAAEQATTLLSTQWHWTSLLTDVGIAALVGMLVCESVKRIVSRPLMDAAAAARRLAAGDLSKQMPVRRGDEVGAILDSLNAVNIGMATLIGNVRRSTESLTAAAREIAAGNVDLSARTEAQAGSLEQTAAAMEQLSATVRNNADNAHQAHDCARETSNLANAGAGLMGDADITMQAIRATSHNVEEIIGVIESIAFQTNILALNAAVEAARVGTEGRGFSVVAAEVRALAHRSAEAAREIKALIMASVDQVDQGAGLIERVGGTMSEIVTSVMSATALMAEVSRASTEQSVGIEEVNRAVSDMDTMTQANAALVEQATAASTSMRDQTDRLETAVRAFRLATDYS